jgi:hypothetical protein
MMGRVLNGYNFYVLLLNLLHRSGPRTGWQIRLFFGLLDWFIMKVVS